MHLDDPTFPPLLNGVPVKGNPGPFELACEGARAGAAGAGDVYWARSASTFSVAVVLEPEVALTQAVHMHYAAMVAFGDAFGALAPPEVGVFYQWPTTLMVNAARVGGMRLGLPEDATDDAVPTWLVTGVEVRLSVENRRAEPGHDIHNTSLEDEGCGDLDRTRLIESFSRHLLVWIHSWNEDGFRPVHDAWIGRANDVGKQATFELGGGEHSGIFTGIDDEGNLLLGTTGEETVSLRIIDAAERFG
jgi:biotin-(acetyl-CoA carboxylase) ligase